MDFFYELEDPLYLKRQDVSCISLSLLHLSIAVFRALSMVEHFIDIVERERYYQMSMIIYQ